MSTAEFNKCVELFADRIFRFILKNIRDEDDAKDVVQNTFEILWKNHEKIDFEKAKSYLFTVSYHNMIDGIRKMKRITRLEDNHDLISDEERHYSGSREILNEALSRLPDIQRTVVILRDYEGYDYEEIGKITELSESQVKVYIFRARQALKNYLISVEKVI
jgi:RNA polymerase sigma-70 factor (ECF subfamily)